MRSIFLLAAATLAASAPTLTSSVTSLTTPTDWTTITWSGVTAATKADWIAIACTGGTYYYWIMATGTSDGSLPMRLFANSHGSGCVTLEAWYYNGADVLMKTAPITVAPMIQQVHLSLTSNATEMVVDFVSTGVATSAAFCLYGKSKSELTSSAVATTSFVPTIGNVSHALLSGLVPGTQYYYTCSDGDVVSQSNVSFIAGAVPQSGQPQRVAVWADFGVNDGFGLDQIAEDAAAGAFDFAVHSGDWAYNLDTGNSANGNFFMNRASLYSASLPVQPACGNHEAAANFSEYQLRHPGVAANSNTHTALYYSYENELVHYLVFNSETYIDGGITAMLNFMRSDLASVDRSRTPWVVAYSHKL
jgi:hypothetical protein